jgi:hypothetical protein
VLDACVCRAVFQYSTQLSRLFLHNSHFLAMSTQNDTSETPYYNYSDSGSVSQSCPGSELEATLLDSESTADDMFGSRPPASKSSSNETYESVLSRLQPLAPKTINHSRSYKLLEEARVRATNDPESQYCTRTFKNIIRDEVKKRCNGISPYWYQEDVAEAFYLGLDVSYLAGTGFGKTLPFVMPLFLDKSERSTVIIISPLNALERDQVRVMSCYTLCCSLYACCEPRFPHSLTICILFY